MRYILAAVVAALFLAFAAVVIAAASFIMASMARAESCAPAAVVMRAIEARPDFQSDVVATPQQAKVASDIYNSWPPVSSVAWDLVVLVTAKDGSGAIIVGHGRELCGFVRVDASRWSQVLRHIVGIGT